MPDQETLTRRVVVEGLVQGVGYRHFAYHAALKLGLSGWVRNRPDGTVEALISGSPDAIEAMLAELRRGPRWADVRSVRLAEAAGETWTPGTFAVRSTG
jgi:acylphosphatase